mgnify:FL=1
MAIKIGAFGYGLAAILGAGAVLLAVLNNSLWFKFLIAAIVVFIISIIARKI